MFTGRLFIRASTISDTVLIYIIRASTIKDTILIYIRTSTISDTILILIVTHKLCIKVTTILMSLY